MEVYKIEERIEAVDFRQTQFERGKDIEQCIKIIQIPQIGDQIKKQILSQVLFRYFKSDCRKINASKRIFGEIDGLAASLQRLL